SCGALPLCGAAVGETAPNSRLRISAGSYGSLFFLIHLLPVSPACCLRLETAARACALVEPRCGKDQCRAKARRCCSVKLRVPTRQCRRAIPWGRHSWPARPVTLPVLLRCETPAAGFAAYQLRNCLWFPGTSRRPAQVPPGITCARYVHT